VIRALLLLLLLPALAQAEQPRLAVTYFANHSGDSEFDPLGHGLAEMLITDLAGVSSLQVVERLRLNEVLGELELQQSSFIDPSTAVEVGKGLGASYVLVGSFATVAPQMRIDARIVEVATQEVVEAAAVTGPSEEFFLLEKELAANIIDELGVGISARETAKMGRVATESFEAFKAYSTGLKALDSGALETARRAMEQALAADDRFSLAESMLADLKASMAKSLESRRLELSAVTRKLLAAIDGAAGGGGPWDGIGPLIQEAQVALLAGHRWEELAAVCERLLGQGLPEELALGPYPGAQSVNEWALGNAAQAAASLLRQADFLTYGQAFLERYPRSPSVMTIQTPMQRLLESMEEQAANRAFRQRALDSGAATANRLWCNDAEDPKTKLDRCRTAFLEARDGEVDADEVEDAREAYLRVATGLGRADELTELRDAARAKDPYSDETIELDKAVAAAGKALETFARRQQKLEDNRGTDKLRAYHFRDAIDELLAFSRVEDARTLVAELLATFPDDDTSYRTAIEFHLRVREAKQALDVVPAWEASIAAGDDDRRKVMPQLVQRARKALQAPVETPREAYLLMYQATALNGVKQFGEAADRFLKLAERYPDYKYMAGPSALQQAAVAYQQAWNRDGYLRSLSLILERYPDSSEATYARTMMGLSGR
jgi:TolB-like protein